MPSSPSSLLTAHAGPTETGKTSPKPPLVCFSHLRWDSVTQRPQHLMRRFARERRVFVFEEHIPCDHHLPYLEYHPFPADGVIALRPRLPHWWDEAERTEALRGLLDMLVATSMQDAPVLWFYTPMMYAFADRVASAAIAYDCMDELSAFRFADPALRERERRLLLRADVVFAGGHSLCEAKRTVRPDAHAFPSAVEASHFAAARDPATRQPADQAAIPGPILGYYGVIDERLDLALIDAVAAARPDWSIVMIGPVVKLGREELPRRANIHWLGPRPYAGLPGYLSGWDAALMPFALNEATRFISPTKTPEYLAGGCPVVSTPVVDVVRQYGSLAGVAVADTPERFVAACDRALALPRTGAWRDEADGLLAGMSWDATFAAMSRLVETARAQPPAAPPARTIMMPGVARPANRLRSFDTVVVGAGFAGSVLAERLAAGSGRRVLVLDKRPHIAGNAYDHHDRAGVLVHKYGPHIFHTNSKSVVEYLSRFTRWRPYEHRVLARVGDRLVPMPINRTTLNALYGLDLQDDAAAAAFLAARAEPVAEIRTSEDVVVAAVGRELYETFFRGYTRKQWGLDPSQLDRSVTARVPTRTGTDDRYFTDQFQAMPQDGYTRMFSAMLDHENITVEVGVDYRDVRDELVAEHVVYTGPVDEYFDHRFGRLPYRSLEFRHETYDMARFQPVGVVNEPSESVPHTRVTEYKHLTGQEHHRTSVSYEYARDEGDPYYPIPRPDNAALYRRYEALAAGLPDVSFVGRLATYRYYNMDQVVGQALATYRRLVERDRTPGRAGASPAVAAAAAQS